MSCYLIFLLLLLLLFCASFSVFSFWFMADWRPKLFDMFSQNKGVYLRKTIFHSYYYYFVYVNVVAYVFIRTLLHSIETHFRQPILPDLQRFCRQQNTITINARLYSQRPSLDFNQADQSVFVQLFTLIEYFPSNASFLPELKVHNYRLCALCIFFFFFYT